MSFIVYAYIFLSELTSSVWEISWLVCLQDIDAEEKGVPVANVSSNDTSSDDLRIVSEGVSAQAPSHSSSQQLDGSKRSTGHDICSTLQFSLQDLKNRRQQRLSLFHSSNGICQRMKSERCIY